MKPVINAIDLTDALTLVAVWELKDQSWDLLMLARPQGAIALCREQPSKRLVFLTGVSPSGVWRRACIKDSTSSLFPVEEEPTQKPPSSREMVLELIKTSSGQSSAMLAEQLGISVAAVGQLLRKLESLGEIHHRLDPIHSKIRLYYPGAMSSSITNIPAVASTCKAASLAPREPPLKVYFVDPRTLQKVGK